MVSSRSQASGWCLRVQVVEAGPSRIPFQYPCLCYSSPEFSLLSSQMLQIYMANLLALCIPLIPTGSLAGLGVLES